MGKIWRFSWLRKWTSYENRTKTKRTASWGAAEWWKNCSYTIFIAKVINEFLRLFSTWTDFKIEIMHWVFTPWWRGHILECTMLYVPLHYDEVWSLQFLIRLRWRRNTEDGEIGYVSMLNGDGHTHAVVRWSGYPSDVVFVLTRRRTRASRYTNSDQSWLWRYEHIFYNY